MAHRLSPLTLRRAEAIGRACPAAGIGLPVAALRRRAIVTPVAGAALPAVPAAPFAIAPGATLFLAGLPRRADHLSQGAFHG